MEKRKKAEGLARMMCSAFAVQIAPRPARPAQSLLGSGRELIAALHCTLLDEERHCCSAQHKDAIVVAHRGKLSYGSKTSKTKISKKSNKIKKVK